MLFISLILKRLRRGTRLLHGWRLPLAILVFVFFSSWLLLWIAEPGNEMVLPQHYHYFFTTTLTTVGYGDYSPKTSAGQIIVDYVQYSAIATGTLLIGQVITYIVSRKGKNMSGLASHDLNDHVLVVGYLKGRTTELVQYLLADSPDRDIVICAPEAVVESHPMPDNKRVHFVRGPYDEAEGYVRANITSAAFAIIDTGDDNETVFAAIQVRELAPNLHVAASVHNLRAARSKFTHVDGKPVEQVAAACLTQLADVASTPGVGTFLNDFSSADGDINSHVAPVPSKFHHRPLGELAIALGTRHQGAQVLYLLREGVRQVNGPAWDTKILPGDRVGYMARIPFDATVISA